MTKGALSLPKGALVQPVRLSAAELTEYSIGEQQAERLRAAGVLLPVAEAATPARGEGGGARGEGADGGVEKPAHHHLHHGGGTAAADFEAQIAVLRQLARPQLPLRERRALEPKPESSVFSQTSYIILMVRGRARGSESPTAAAAVSMAPYPPPLLPRRRATWPTSRPSRCTYRASWPCSSAASA